MRVSGGDNHHHDHHHPELSEAQLRTSALESLLTEKRLVNAEAIDKLVEFYEHDIGPLTGARVVARAWTDPAFKARLLANPPSALKELGITGADNLQVVENTPEVHNMVCCTLCSCYPWAVLGLPPRWYKDHAYRARAVIEPRAVLNEFGVTIPESVEVRVWDSSAEQRYLVLPMRPAGTDGMNEAELTALVTRDSMIGTGLPLGPARVPR
jgi:nitrile hydratase subunit alpha